VYYIDVGWIDGFWTIVLDEVGPISLCVGFSY
jgi:hypothetical protein